MSDRWKSTTLADLHDAKLSVLVSALRTKALASGQSDPSARITQGVVDDIRRKIASCATNRLDADVTTLPVALVPMAADLTIFRMKGRLEIALEEDEVRTQSRHERNLDRIADCTDKVDQPDDAAEPEVQPAVGTPRVTTNRRETRNAARGL